ncbi:ABC transporter permease [Pseudorhodoferax sp.]|uniref:ABC transporter permease n=1 Tax=Pseudorhodoferax sp. TaxID=1993553 RepID=UPI002DD62590|nr:ABC transporter permease [Pseudorhodoferax sp.]
MQQTPKTIDPHAQAPVAVTALVASVCRNRNMILQMTRREVSGRYKGSVLGLAWSFFHPVFMLAVYTFVFSVIFQSRWGSGDDGRAAFAVMLFVGMIVAGLFGEIVNRAPGLVVSNVNYVKKVVFPLEVLPVISTAAALFHSAVSIAVLLVAVLLLQGQLHWTVLLMPIVLAPLVLLATGLAWFAASLGVFLRDVGQFTAIAVTVLTFLAPVFYPITAVPERFVPFVLLNPLTFIIEQARAVLVLGRLPDWAGLGIYALVACCVAWMGFAWFQKTKRGFADVL